MGKPPKEVYDSFKKKFFEITKSIGKEQYLVPYLISSHPGATLNDAVELALYLKEWGYSPEQVQDFYPTPGTASTTMFYTGIDPFTNKKIYVSTDYEEKKMQRALLQFSDPANAEIVRQALIKCGREDLIGFDKKCLVKPKRKEFEPNRRSSGKNDSNSKNRKTPTNFVSKSKDKKISHLKKNRHR